MPEVEAFAPDVFVAIGGGGFQAGNRILNPRRKRMLGGKTVVDRNDFNPTRLADESAKMIVAGDATNNEASAVEVNQPSPNTALVRAVAPCPEGRSGPWYQQIEHPRVCLCAAQGPPKTVIAAAKPMQRQTMGTWPERGQPRQRSQHTVSPDVLFATGRHDRSRDLHPARENLSVALRRGWQLWTRNLLSWL